MIEPLENRQSNKQAFVEEYKALCNFHRQVVTLMSWLNSKRLQAVEEALTDEEWVAFVSDIQYGASLRVVADTMINVFENKFGIKWPHNKITQTSYYDEIECVLEQQVATKPNAQSILQRAATTTPGPAQCVMQDGGFDHSHNLYDPPCKFYNGEDANEYKAAEEELQKEWDQIIDKQAGKMLQSL